MRNCDNSKHITKALLWEYPGYESNPHAQSGAFVLWERIPYESILQKVEGRQAINTKGSNESTMLRVQWVLSRVKR